MARQPLVLLLLVLLLLPRVVPVEPQPAAGRRPLMGVKVVPRIKDLPIRDPLTRHLLLLAPLDETTAFYTFRQPPSSKCSLLRSLRRPPRTATSYPSSGRKNLLLGSLSSVGTSRAGTPLQHSWFCSIGCFLFSQRRLFPCAVPW